MKEARVTIVGAGVMGCATAYALARRGVDVTLIEQFRLGHKRGSSHGTSRIFRFSYPDARYVAMAMEALPLWRALEREADESLLVTTGGLDMGKDLKEHAAALRACGAPSELLRGARAAARFPHLSFPDNADVLYQPDAGIVMADRAVATFAAGFNRAGGTLLDETKATALKPKANSVEVMTRADSVTSDCVVVTGGAWAKSLLADVGIQLVTRPTRETVAYFDYDGPPLPTLVEWGAPSVYSLPSPGYGLKVGEHVAGPTTDPNEQGEVNDESVERLQEWVASRYPGAAAKPSFAETCLYTNTPDEHFVLKTYGRIVVGSPCSGHGFKFAPLIGEQLADLAEQVVHG
ncbi:MAG TPA: FAD-dependent oxidoreductase [Actinomycetota bacterium]|nr:FAD-dependent oxidoreductase [Actinomycetota bacterium]